MKKILNIIILFAAVVFCGCSDFDDSELRGRIDEVVDWAGSVRDHGPVWVYCGSGFRASAGASVLEAAGVEVVHVDDDFPNAEKAGLRIERPVHGHRLGAAYAD